MIYSILLAASARADLREAMQWMRAERSQAVADQWLSGIQKAIRRIADHPERHPLAAESEKFSTPVREALHGKGRRGKYRILYQVEDPVIFVLHVRHSSRDEIEP